MRVILAAILCAQLAVTSASATTCVDEIFFPLVTKQKQRGGLTQAQRKHVELLKSKVQIKGAFLLPKNPYTYSFVRYIDGFSVIGDADCKGICKGSLMININNDYQLYNIALGDRKGVLENQLDLGLDGKPTVYASDVVKQHKLSMAVMSDDRKSVSVFEQYIPTRIILHTIT